MAAFVEIIIEQISNLGVSGAIIAGLLYTTAKLWNALQKERRRTNILADKLHELSKETAIMIERVSGR